MQIFRDWYHRYFSDPQAVILAVLLVSGTLFIMTMGRILTPVLASIVIAYLLEGPVSQLQRLRIPRVVAVLLASLFFMAFLLFLLLGLLPVISQQIGDAISELPSMISRGQELLMRLPERYPELVSPEQIMAVMDSLRSELGNLGQRLLTLSVASVRGLITFLVYLVLMPLLVFFFLKDKDLILRWLSNFLPEERSLSTRVWREVDQEIGNYVRGKFWEIIIVWSASLFAFYSIGLQFAMLNALLVGLSVLVPYIGAVVAVFPVALMGYSQWGPSSNFLYAVISYVVIQILDGNLLAPLLLSGVVNLHPVAIIVAILIFGGIWGFWGIFFAIPLATLVHALLKAWPRRER